MKSLNRRCCSPYWQGSSNLNLNLPWCSRLTRPTDTSVMLMGAVSQAQSEQVVATASGQRNSYWSLLATVLFIPPTRNQDFFPSRGYNCKDRKHKVCKCVTVTDEKRQVQATPSFSDSFHLYQLSTIWSHSSNPIALSTSCCLSSIPQATLPFYPDAGERIRCLNPVSTGSA